MQKTIEAEGKTVEEAIEKALLDLKLTRSQVKIKVLCEEKKGLFNMPGEMPAKIQVTILKKQK